MHVSCWRRWRGTNWHKLLVILSKCVHVIVTHDTSQLLLQMATHFYVGQKCGMVCCPHNKIECAKVLLLLSCGVPCMLLQEESRSYLGGSAVLLCPGTPGLQTWPSLLLPGKPRAAASVMSCGMWAKRVYMLLL